MRASERGGASLLAVTFAGLLLVVGAALGVVAAILVAHRTAQAAADLAALAGAAALAEAGDPCGRATAVADANGATLDSCTVEGDDVVIAVTVAGPHWLGQTADLDASARAGPIG